MTLKADTALVERMEDGRQKITTDGPVPKDEEPLSTGNACNISAGKAGKFDGDCNAFMALFSRSCSWKSFLINRDEYLVVSEDTIPALTCER